MFLTAMCIAIISLPIFYKFLLEKDDIGWEKIFIAIQAILCSLGVFMSVCILWYFIKKIHIVYQ